MRTEFEFSNLCGGIYQKGNVVFSTDGKNLLSPVGNRISCFDLPNNRHMALPCHNRKNIRCCDLSADGSVLVTVDEDGKVIFFNFQYKVKMTSLHFRSKVRAVKFSPGGTLVAFAVENMVQVYTTPPLTAVKYQGCVRVIKWKLWTSAVTSLQWSPDSKYVLCGSKDKTARLLSVSRVRWMTKGGKKVVSRPHLTFGGHKFPVVNAFFANDGCTEVYTISSDRSVFIWKQSAQYREGMQPSVTTHLPETDAPDEDEPDTETEQECSSSDQEQTNTQKKKSTKRKRTQQQHSASNNTNSTTSDNAVAHLWAVDNVLKRTSGSKVSRVAFNSSTSLLVFGFKNGAFELHRLVDGELTLLHELSFSRQPITTIDINCSGEWIAFGAAKLGQLMVWEWRTEQYVLKQQAHQASDISAIAYSNDGTLLATGGEDGKIKIWRGSQGFCFVTFRDHSGPVTGLLFTNQDAVLSCSADGSIRAYDLLRYRNFRIFTANEPVQFSCLSIDQSGDFLAAGASDSFSVYLWSMRTGRLLEILTGHEGAVSCVSFCPTKNALLTTSWDKTFRVWQVFGATEDERGKGDTEAHPLFSEALHAAWKPDGTEIAVVTLNGDIQFFSSADLSDVHETRAGISVQRDIMGGIRQDEPQLAPYSRNAGQYVNAISFSPDGKTLLTGGNTKWICLYAYKERFLLNKWAVSTNLSLSGVNEQYNKHFQTEAGTTYQLEESDSSDNELHHVKLVLPGVQKGQYARIKRQSQRVARSRYVTFSPTGREWAAGTTDGLLVFSVEGSKYIFNPIKLSASLSPQQIIQSLQEKSYSKALHQAIQLNDKETLTQVFYLMPVEQIEWICEHINKENVQPLLQFVANQLEVGVHIQFCMHWLLILLKKWATTPLLQEQPTVIRSIQKALMQFQTDLTTICTENKYHIRFIQAQQSHSHPTPNTQNTNETPLPNGTTTKQLSEEEADVEDALQPAKKKVKKKVIKKIKRRPLA